MTEKWFYKGHVFTDLQLDVLSKTLSGSVLFVSILEARASLQWKRDEQGSQVEETMETKLLH